MKTNVNEKRKIANERIKFIKEFAVKMDYEILEEDYLYCIGNSPAHSIELIDSMGHVYSWAWYTDTWDEI